MVTPTNAALHRRPYSSGMSMTARPPARSLPGSTGRAGQSDQPERKALVMRRYSISALLPDGQVRDSDQIGPAMPAFEAAFCAFAHGTLIATTQGQVPVEDLVPGTEIVTETFGPMPLRWVGAMTLMPRSDQFPTSGSLTRITADSFGFGRPQTDIMAGPGARFLLRPTGASGGERALIPAAQLADGMNAIAIAPPSPVTVYHLCLDRHAILSAGGLQAESFHPGAGFERQMGPNMLSLFLSFFPHIREPHDFGPLAHPRLPLGESGAQAEVA